MSLLLLFQPAAADAPAPTPAPSPSPSPSPSPAPTPAPTPAPPPDTPLGGSMAYVYDPGPQRPNKRDDLAELDELFAMAFALIASGALDAR